MTPIFNWSVSDVTSISTSPTPSEQFDLELLKKGLLISSWIALAYILIGVVMTLIIVGLC